MGIATLNPSYLLLDAILHSLRECIFYWHALYQKINDQFPMIADLRRQFAFVDFIVVGH